VNLPLKVKRFQIKVRVEGNGTNLGQSCRVRTVGRRRQGGATGKPSQRSLPQVASPVAFSSGKRANCLCLPQSTINSIMDHPLRLSLSYNNLSCRPLSTRAVVVKEKNQLTVVCYRVYLTKSSAKIFSCPFNVNLTLNLAASDNLMILSCGFVNYNVYT
jgi:hypothetical protein